MLQHGQCKAWLLRIMFTTVVAVCNVTELRSCQVSLCYMCSCMLYTILSLIVLGGMFTVAEAAAAAEGGINFKLKEGYSAETSGRLTQNDLVMVATVFLYPQVVCWCV